VAVGKDGYLKVFDLDQGRELTNQRVPKPMARTNTCILDYFGTTRSQARLDNLVKLNSSVPDQ
jgi:hypothetical protein